MAMLISCGSSSKLPLEVLQHLEHHHHHGTGGHRKKATQESGVRVFYQIGVSVDR